MVENHLENAKTSILNGKRDDQEIHTGTVVQFSKQVNIQIHKKESDSLDKAIKDFLVKIFWEALKSLCNYRFSPFWEI